MPFVPSVGRRLLLGWTVGLAAWQLPPQPPLPPAWPVSAPVELNVELDATARELAEPDPPSGGPAAADEDLAVPDTPFIQAIRGEAAGLSYVEAVMGDVDVDASLPLVLMLHGRGDRPRVPGGPFACVSVPLRIVMPQAPEPLGPGFTWLSVRVADGRTDELGRQLAARADQLVDLLRDVLARRPTRGRPIVAGFSQGALLTFTLVTRHAGLTGAAFPLAGWLPPRLWPESAEALPLIRAVHGGADTTVPLAPTREVVAYLQDLGADIELVEYDAVGHVMTSEMNRQFERWLEQALRVEAPVLATASDDTRIEGSEPQEACR